jgi:hypothetical protein
MVASPVWQAIQLPGGPGGGAVGFAGSFQPVRAPGSMRQTVDFKYFFGDDMPL